MEDLVALSVRVVKRSAAVREMSIPLQKDNESRSNKQSYSNELSENSRKMDVRWRERLEKKGRLVKLVGDQNQGPEAPTISKKRREEGAKKISGKE